MQKAPSASRPVPAVVDLGRPGKGLLVAAVLLLAVECYLHTDAFLHRYRSVFAAGRAVDKTAYAQRHCPAFVVLGNSRADNAFDPRTMRRELTLPIGSDGFNLGLPGADTRVLAGVVDRLSAAGCLREGGTRYVVLSLDEALVQPIDTLGQEVFFADRRRLLADGQFHDLFRSLLRLYGYSSNLRQLREPGTLQRFVDASTRDIDPVGGGAALHLGYRAGFGGLQDQQSVQRQEATSQAPPDAVNVSHLWRLLDVLVTQGVRVAVVLPPLLNRGSLYASGSSPDGAPYRSIAAELHRRQIPVIALDDGRQKEPAEFVNAGHLNDRGAQRHSRMLAAALNRVWGQSSPQARLGPLQPTRGAS